MHLGNLSQITLPNMWLLLLILSQTSICSTLRWLWHLSIASFDVKYRTEDLELLFVFPSPWSSVFEPSFPQIVKMLKIPKNRSNSILRWLCQSSKASFNVNHGIGHFELLFMCPSSSFGVSGPSFTKLP